jgi:hypothetical protein
MPEENMTNEPQPDLPPASPYLPPTSPLGAPTTAPTTVSGRKDMPWLAYIAATVALMLLAWWRFATLLPTPSRMPLVLAAAAGVVLLIPAIVTFISVLVGSRYRIAGIVTLTVVVTLPSVMTLAWEASHDPMPAPSLTWPAGWTALPVSRAVAGNMVTSRAVLTVNKQSAANLIAIKEGNSSSVTLEAGINVVVKSERAFASLKNMTLDVSPPVEVTWDGYRALEYDIVMHTDHGLVRQRSIRTNGTGKLACSLSYVAGERIFDSHLDAYDAIKHQFVCRPGG